MEILKGHFNMRARSSREMAQRQLCALSICRGRGRPWEDTEEQVSFLEGLFGVTYFSGESSQTLSREN